MYMAPELLTSASFAVSDLGTGQQHHARSSHAEPVSVDISEIELQPSIKAGPDVRCAAFDISMVSEANHLQERCVDMAMELCLLKAKFGEQEKELKWAKREADARERDLKEMQRVCEEERHSSRSFMRRVKALEEENTKLGEENADLRLDKERLLRVLRRHREAGRSESVAAHRDRIHKRNMPQNEVNRCDLASAKLGLKAVTQENGRLISKARGQASRIRTLESNTEVLVNKLAEVEEDFKSLEEQKAAVELEAHESIASELRIKSDMEHEALLRLEALERASSAEKAEEEGREVRALAKLEAESLRAQLVEVSEKLETKDSARSRHQETVVRYQKMIDTQAAALQAAREQLLGERVRRQESDRRARLQHIATIDSKMQQPPAPIEPATTGVREKERPRQLTPEKK